VNADYFAIKLVNNDTSNNGSGSGQGLHKTSVQIGTNCPATQERASKDVSTLDVGPQEGVPLP